MDKRFQVFVSSTFADLQTERQNVIMTLMEMDCIPAGMELFPAADEEQWQFIKRVIDDCDYYILIIGGRYGSLTNEGISYTEKEYDYAMSQGLKVLAFVHEAPDEIPVGKSDIDPELREKLGAFRAKVCDGRLVKFWKNASDLPGLVALSLTKTIKVYPAVGWMRANNLAGSEALADLNELRKENAQLKIIVSEYDAKPGTIKLSDLATFDDKILIPISWNYIEQGRKRSANGSKELSWEELFACIAPDLVGHPNDGSVRNMLGSAIHRKIYPGGTQRSAFVEHDVYQTIKIQFQALGLVKIQNSVTTTGGMALFWDLTPKGMQLMMQLRTVKKVSEPVD